MNRDQKTHKLVKAIVEEAINHGVGDPHDITYNKDYTVDIGLTIEELRLAFELYGKKPSPRQLKKAIRVGEWESYLRELDSAGE